jgi:hypothetical protein
VGVTLDKDSMDFWNVLFTAIFDFISCRPVKWQLQSSVLGIDGKDVKHTSGYFQEYSMYENRTNSKQIRSMTLKDSIEMVGYANTNNDKGDYNDTSTLTRGGQMSEERQDRRINYSMESASSYNTTVPGLRKPSIYSVLHSSDQYTSSPMLSSSRSLSKSGHSHTLSPMSLADKSDASRNGSNWQMAVAESDVKAMLQASISGSPTTFTTPGANMSGANTTYPLPQRIDEEVEYYDQPAADDESKDYVENEF